MRRAAAVDQNQAGLIKELHKLNAANRKAGQPADVISIANCSSLGGGFPDLVFGYRGRNYFGEVKNPEARKSDQKLTTDQVAFKDAWHGQYDVVFTVGDVLKLIRYRGVPYVPA